MKLSQQEQDRIYEEESVRWQARLSIKHQQRPDLLLMTILWTVALTLLVVITAHHN